MLNLWQLYYINIYIFKKFIFLFVRNALKLSKVTVKTLKLLQKNLFELLNFLSICKSSKLRYMMMSTILCSTTVFNIDNNQECFCLKTGVMML